MHSHKHTQLNPNVRQKFVHTAPCFTATTRFHDAPFMMPHSIECCSIASTSIGGAILQPQVKRFALNRPVSKPWKHHPFAWYLLMPLVSAHAVCVKQAVGQHAAQLAGDSGRRA